MRRESWALQATGFVSSYLLSFTQLMMHNNSHSRFFFFFTDRHLHIRVRLLPLPPNIVLRQAAKLHSPCLSPAVTFARSSLPSSCRPLAFSPRRAAVSICWSTLPSPAWDSSQVRLVKNMPWIRQLKCGHFSFNNWQVLSTPSTSSSSTSEAVVMLVTTLTSTFRDL